MRPSDRAWVALAAGVLAYDVLAADEEMLSEAADRYLACRPWLTRAVVATVALHLLNLMPRQIDPLYQLSALVGR